MQIKELLPCGNLLATATGLTAYMVDGTETAICFNGAVYVSAKKSLASKLNIMHCCNIFIVFIYLVFTAYPWCNGNYE